MLRSVEDLEKYHVEANDGPIGHVRDFFFDDGSWVVRYVVVDTGGWLLGRKVLISPISIGLVDAGKRRLQVLLNREQIEKSPDIDSDMPVSRRHERRYFEHYGYPCYWGGTGLWGDGSFPSLMISDIDSRADDGRLQHPPLQPPEHGKPSEPEQDHPSQRKSSLAKLDGSPSAKHDDPHLRSCKSVLNHEIKATDGLLGHVEGFLVDEDTWAIRYLTARTSHWWLGHRVLITPDSITSVNWSARTVEVNLSRAAIKELLPLESA